MRMFLVSFMFLFFLSSSWGQIKINEYSCSNITGPVDVFGQNEDWIELINVSGSNVNLSGWYLSDRPTNLTKWAIPSGTIAPNGYAMVFCSKRNLVNGNELHPNFNLSQTDGEWIILSNPALAVVDSFKIVHLTQQNHSVGRTTNGANTFSLFTTPTPNASNVGAIPFYTPKPTFSLAPGFYPSAQTVSISCSNPSATIRYTLDGSTPTAASNLYIGPLSISTTTVLRAICLSANLPSFVETNTYFINVTHTIPVISICDVGIYDLIANGNQGPTSNIGAFEFFEDNGVFIDEGQGDFNKHGNDSWAYAQRGFDYINRDQYGYNGDIEHPIFPYKTRTKFQRLILKAAANDNYPFSGGAHIRDAFVHELSARADLRLDERTWRPCVLYLNGQYWGVYDIREKADDHDFTEYYSNQDRYHIEYLKTWGGTWEEYGAPNALNNWNNLKGYIQSNNMGVASNFQHVDSLLNWRSLADYFMLNSYCVTTDWLNWNTAWWRGIDTAGNEKKWRYTLWDLDATFGHYINYTGVPSTAPDADPCNAENLPDPGGQGHTTLLSKLINENPEVHQYYITRYIDLLNTKLSCSYAIGLLDSMIAEIAPEMPGQVGKWGGTLAEWNTNVQVLRDYMNARCTALTQGLVDCYSLTGPHAVTFNVSPPNSGEIKVNSVWAPTYPWATTYFGGIETNLVAKAKTGFVFSHWVYATGPLLLPFDSDTNSVIINAPENLVAVFLPLDTTVNPTGVTGIHFPTAFSPNGVGDLQNEQYGIIVGDDVQDFVFYVYDRWGNTLFQSDDKNLRWDGSYKGMDCNSGVYAYMADVRFKTGKKKVYSGNITLIR